MLKQGLTFSKLSILAPFINYRVLLKDKNEKMKKISTYRKQISSVSLNSAVSQVNIYICDKVHRISMYFLKY